MVKYIAPAFVVACLLAHPAAAQDAKTVLANAAKAIGADSVQALTVYGSGNQFESTSPAGQPTPIPDFRQSFDFNQPARRGGNQVALTPPVAAADGTWAAQYDTWITPWGFLRGAAANGATLATRRIGNERVYVVSWNAPFKAANGNAYRVVGYISAATHVIDAVETWVDTPGAPNLHMKRLYGSWKDAGNGVKFPGTVLEQRGGRPVLGLQLARVDVNPVSLLDVVPAGGQARPVGVVAE